MARQAIFEASVHYFLEPIGRLLDDESVSEIMVNRYDDVYVERNGKLEHTDIRFADDDALLSAIHNIAQWVGREISEEHPVLDARLPNGSRVHAVIPPSARTGIYLTIRKFTREALTLDDLVRFGSLSEAAKEFLEICVRLRKNMLISGGTGTGKTVLLGAVSRAIPEEERIVVIEDTSELRLIQRHTLYLEARHADRAGRGALGVRELFVNSLRMRPDRIIVGEVRGGEALDLVQSMISGHAGSMSTIHANAPLDALIRLETLSLMSDVESLVGLLACGLVMLACFVLLKVGGGDVKLIAMLGAFMGPEQGITAMLWTFVLGACMGLIMLIWRVRPVRLVMFVFWQIVCLLRLGSPSPLSEAERAQLQSPLFLAPSALAAVVIVRFSLMTTLL